MTVFKAMTWNLENLFSPSDPEEVQEYQEKLQTLATVILNLDADVIGLQEVGGTEPLQDLLDLLGGGYPHHQLSTEPDSRGIRVGFISKLPIQDSE